MSDLEHALSQISEIRRQIARSEVFRGYGPAAVACTGGVALLAGAVQSWFIAEPAAHPTAYLLVWLAAATLAAGIVGVEMVTRSRRAHSGLAEEMIVDALEQFLPAAVSGALLTWVVHQYVPSVFWLMPALWQMIYGLGIFASCRFLPRPLFLAGAWYLASSMVVLVSLPGPAAFSPAAMAVPFGCGQLLTAALLYWTLERDA